MAAGNGEQELRDARKQISDQFLGSHLEKHDLEQDALKLARSADQEAVKTALDAEKQRDEDHRIAHHAAHDAHSVLHKVTEAGHVEQHQSEHRAVEAAQTAMDKRLNLLNEFRDQLRDQAATFVRRDQYDAFVAHYDKAHDEVLAQVATEREERRANEGGRRGSSASINWIIAAIGVVGTILTIVIVLSNVLTRVP